MKLKMKKIVATTLALALALSGAFMFGITSKAANSTEVYIDSIELSAPVLYSGNTFGFKTATYSSGAAYKNLPYAVTSSNSYINVSNNGNKQYYCYPSDANGEVIYDDQQIVAGNDYYYSITLSIKTSNINEVPEGADYERYFLTNDTKYVLDNPNSSIVSVNYPYSTNGKAGTVELVVKTTAVQNPNEQQAEPQAEVPAEAVEEAPAVEPQAEVAPAEETPAPAETVKAENTAPKTGDTLPIVPFVLMGLGVVAGSVVILQKRYF